MLRFLKSEYLQLISYPCFPPFGGEWVGRAAAGKNAAVIKGSFPFVMQTYDRPTLTPLPSPSVTSARPGKGERGKSEGRARKPFAAQWRGIERERGTKKKRTK